MNPAAKVEDATHKAAAEHRHMLAHPRAKVTKVSEISARNLACDLFSRYIHSTSAFIMPAR